jgi:hypothetical protein
MASSQKLLICGFPHCGTSILKSIIGHIEEVEEIDRETRKIGKNSSKKFVLCKWPFTDEEFFRTSYDNYIKIFIIRNPLYVFSSLNKRFKYKIPHNHSFDGYIKTIKLFNKYRNNPQKNIYTIRYEDLFENDYNNLKKILDDIGITYDNEIFCNEKYRNTMHPGIELVDYKPPNTQHAIYRTWQINQPFVSNNDISKIDLSKAQIDQIVNSPDVLQLYPNIKMII